jgi:hypothetical protein
MYAASADKLVPRNHGDFFRRRSPDFPAVGKRLRIFSQPCVVAISPWLSWAKLRATRRPYLRTRAAAFAGRSSRKIVPSYETAAALIFFNGALSFVH